MRYQIFAPLLALQGLNLFWYFFIWRIAYRYVFTSIADSRAHAPRLRAITDVTLDDDRSDDEDDGEDEVDDKED